MYMKLIYTTFTVLSSFNSTMNKYMVGTCGVRKQEYTCVFISQIDSLAGVVQLRLRTWVQLRPPVQHKGLTVTPA